MDKLIDKLQAMRSRIPFDIMNDDFSPEAEERFQAGIETAVAAEEIEVITGMSYTAKLLRETAVSLLRKTPRGW